MRKGWLRAAALCGTALLARAALHSYRSFDLRGKSVLIVGGSRGLGLELAREFARRGARLTICGRDSRTLRRAEEELRRAGAEVLALPCDATDCRQVEDLVRLARERWFRIDVLVNNLGMIQVGPMESMRLEDYAESMDSHFWAPLYATLAVLPEMRARGGGRIVNIASIGGKISVPHLLPYSAGKFALVGLSEGLHAELARDGIAVTTVCPGLMRTGSPRNADFKGRHRAEYAWFSISDSLPLISMNAERAARQIVTACERGDAECILSLPAAVATRVHGLFPGLVSELLAAVNCLLPSAHGADPTRYKGRESVSSWSPSLLTSLTEQAAARNNELNA